MTIREVEPGMNYGVGYDSLSGKVRGEGVIRSEPQVIEGGEGQKISFQLCQVTTTQELAKYLEIHLSASINVALYGSGSLKAKYLSEHKINKFSTYLLVRVVVKNPWRQMLSIKLNNDAQQLLKKNPETFRQSYGDEFVKGLISGGEYFAILDVEATNQEEQQKISNSIRAEGSTWEVAGAFKNSISKIAKNSSIKVISEQLGGSDTTVTQSVEEIINRAVNFPDKVREKAIPYQAIFLDYKAIAGAQGTNLIDITNQRQVIEKLWNYRMKCLDILSNIEYVLNNSEHFYFFSHQDLNNRANEIRAQINNITDRASECANNYRACKLPTDFTIPIVELPQFKKSWASGNYAISDNSQSFRINLLATQIKICLHRTTDITSSDLELFQKGVENKLLQKVHIDGFDKENFCRVQLTLSIDWKEHNSQLFRGNETVFIDHKKWEDKTVIELDESIKVFNDYVEEASLTTEWRVNYSDWVQNDPVKTEEVLRYKLGLGQGTPINWAGETESGDIPKIPELSELRIGLKWVK
ncbi:MAG: hypothetical protein RMX35_06620 [Nostoc sp. DcaGUA01]|nr:hypothetical protein [Nostoc sp. DcaGUA01]